MPLLSKCNNTAAHFHSSQTFLTHLTFLKKFYTGKIFFPQFSSSRRIVTSYQISLHHEFILLPVSQCLKNLFSCMVFRPESNVCGLHHPLYIQESICRGKKLFGVWTFPQSQGIKAWVFVFICSKLQKALASSPLSDLCCDIECFFFPPLPAAPCHPRLLRNTPTCARLCGGWGRQQYASARKQKNVTKDSHFSTSDART